MSKLPLIAFMAACALCVSACGIYSFSGTSIQPDVNTIAIDFFEYTATKVNPSLTKLEQVEIDGDRHIEGTITGYDVSATAITANEVASQNRLTVSAKIVFTNRLHEEDNLEKSFSQYADFPSTQSLDAVENTLCKEIIDKLVEDIFNATVAQW